MVPGTLNGACCSGTLIYLTLHSLGRTATYAFTSTDTGATVWLAGRGARCGSALLAERGECLEEAPVIAAPVELGAVRHAQLLAVEGRAAVLEPVDAGGRICGAKGER